MLARGPAARQEVRIMGSLWSAENRGNINAINRAGEYFMFKSNIGARLFIKHLPPDRASIVLKDKIALRMRPSPPPSQSPEASKPLRWPDRAQGFADVNKAAY
jgi:hypothetical protein